MIFARTAYGTNECGLVRTEFKRIKIPQILARTEKTKGGGFGSDNNPESSAAKSIQEITMTLAYRTVSLDRLRVFYREAGDPDAPRVLSLDGFP